jgi:sensor histidine kinase YesM
MSHPITSQNRSLILYSLIWLALMIVYILMLSIRQELVPVVAVTDGALSSILFALLGLLIWYPTRYIPFQKHNPFYSILAHAVAGCLVLIVWLLVTVGVLSLVFSERSAYTAYLFDGLYWRAFIGVMIYLVMVLVYYLISYNRSLREQAQAEERLKILVKESELNMLKSQINPHFLFNSLNSIASLTMSTPELARDMIIRLSDFLRYSLKHNENKFVTLDEEIGRMEDYLSIEKIRFGEKLRYHFEVNNACREAMLPPMILQPLLENAIKHGVYESIEPVDIEFSCQERDTYLVIELSNDFDPELPRRKGTGIGLQNVSQRIDLAFDGKGSINWKEEDGRFSVVLMIPKIG